MKPATSAKAPAAPDLGAEDITKMQKFLGRNLYGVQLPETGLLDDQTRYAVLYFMKRRLGQDPIVLNRIKTWSALAKKGLSTNGKLYKSMQEHSAKQGNNLAGADAQSLPMAESAPSKMGGADYEAVAKELGISTELLKAVAQVESSGSGFIKSNKPKIRFEAHVFSRYTCHVFDKSHPHISVATRDDDLVKGGDKEFDRLAEAMALDRDAAIKATAWGAFQIQGFESSRVAGNIEVFVAGHYGSELNQLKMAQKFMQSKKYGGKTCVQHLQAGDLESFALAYNGGTALKKDKHGKNYADRIRDAWLKETGKSAIKPHQIRDAVKVGQFSNMA